jgi:TPR repeat protein
MPSADPREPRPSSEQLNPTVIIAGTALIIVALVGAVFGAFVQDRYSSRSVAIPKEQRLEFAERAFQSGDNDVAVAIFSRLAEKNNATAQYWLAHMTELGLGVPRDPSKAISLYEKAAAQNVVPAEARLGEIYLHGDLIPPDFSLAKSYLERAAYHGAARAAMELGQMYRLGLGTPADPTQAYAWLEVASLEGSAFARRERDTLLRGLGEDDQQQAAARANEIMDQIKRETNPPGSTRSN